VIVINLSGRGDKDMFTVAKEDGLVLWQDLKKPLNKIKKIKF
jgi:hypothetical protein